MKLISDFARRFNANLGIDENLIVTKLERYFLLNEELKGLVLREFFYCGTYLGKVKNKMFFPSFPLLKVIAEKDRANKTVVNGKAEWLFVCGRDLLKQGIISVEGSRSKGTYTLVLNEHGECLGFGKVIADFDRANERTAIVKNISDIGDFLRRETQV